jgi:hypothetical protein
VHPTQRFNQQGVAVNCGLLILAGKHNVPKAFEINSISRPPYIGHGQCMGLEALCTSRRGSTSKVWL